MLSNTRSRALIIAAAAAFTLSLAACSPVAAPAEVPKHAASDAPSATDGGCAGVTVIVETGDLEVADDPSGTVCVETDAAIRGSDAVAEAGFTTVGTTAYPDDAVCRVNGVPAEDTDLPGDGGGIHHETCADFPPATAYWALWLKPAGGAWEYAPASLPGLDLNPGDSVQLLFTLDGAPATPAS